MRTFLTILAIFIFSAMAFGADNGTLRDGSGNMVETWSKQGERTQIRDKDGNLSRELHRRGDHIEIRDGDGNLVGEMRKDN
ncbi:MAG: hypothetical protein ACLPVO_15425 [Desulfomonilaceae bacterium]